MSIALVRFGCTFLLMMPSAVELSVCICVGGWGCPISLRMLRSLIALHPLMYKAPDLASAADDMTPLIISAMFVITPLFGGYLTFSERKWCPPARLRTSVSLR